jgi:hypothetical protein
VREVLKIPLCLKGRFTPSPCAKALFRRSYGTTPGPTILKKRHCFYLAFRSDSRTGLVAKVVHWRNGVMLASEAKRAWSFYLIGALSRFISPLPQVKRTSLINPPISASDPKRTLCEAEAVRMAGQP